MLGHGEKKKKKKVQQAKVKSSIIEMNVNSQPGKFSDECDDTDQEKHGHFGDCIRFARLTGNVKPQHNCVCQPSDSHPLVTD